MMQLTSHFALNCSMLPNSLAIASSASSALYCRSERSHISLYSAAGIESFIKAFSTSSKVTMILKTSAKES